MGEAHRGQPIVDLPGNWRSYDAPGRILPGEAIDQPMTMSRIEPGGQRRGPPPAEPEDRSAVVRPQQGAGFLDRLFR
jgi:penicillin-binding protein 1A